MSKFTNRAYLYARMDDDRRVAADRIDALEECLRELISDITDSEHSPNDWSEQVVVRKARALLEE